MCAILESLKFVCISAAQSHFTGTPALTKSWLGITAATVHFIASGCCFLCLRVEKQNEDLFKVNYFSYLCIAKEENYGKF